MCYHKRKYMSVPSLRNQNVHQTLLFLKFQKSLLDFYSSFLISQQKFTSSWNFELLRNVREYTSPFSVVDFIKLTEPFVNPFTLSIEPDFFNCAWLIIGQTLKINDKRSITLNLNIIKNNYQITIVSSTASQSTSIWLPFWLAAPSFLLYTRTPALQR